MNTKKGFTLIEVMAVIVIIIILTIIFMPNIVNNLNNKKNDINDITTNIIYSAAELYADENNYSKENIDFVYCIRLETLVNDGKLVAPITDIKTGKEITLDRNVKLTVNGYNQFEYQLVDECIDNNEL